MAVGSLHRELGRLVLEHGVTAVQAAITPVVSGMLEHVGGPTAAVNVAEKSAPAKRARAAKAPSAPNGKPAAKRVISEASRQKIRDGQKKRWAKEAAAKTASPKPTSVPGIVADPVAAQATTETADIQLDTTADFVQEPVEVV